MRQNSIVSLCLLMTATAALRAQTTAPSTPISPEAIDLGLKEVTAALPLNHWQMVDSTPDQSITPLPQITLTLDTPQHRLLLKGPPASVQAAIDFIQFLDRKDAGILTKTRKLQHLPAPAIARLLNEVFNADQNEELRADAQLLALPAADGKTLLISSWQPGLDQSFKLLDRLDVPTPATDPAGPPKMLFQFEDKPIDEIFDLLEKNFSFIILRPKIVISTRVTIKVPDPVTADQSIKLLNAFLTPLAYQATVFTSPAPDSRTVLHIQQLPYRKSRPPISYGSDPSKIATTDNLITQIIPLSHAKAADVKKQLESLLAPEADCIVNTESNSLQITDTSAHIHAYLQKIQSLDK